MIKEKITKIQDDTNICKESQVFEDFNKILHFSGKIKEDYKILDHYRNQYINCKNIGKDSTKKLKQRLEENEFKLS